MNATQLLHLLAIEKEGARPTKTVAGTNKTVPVINHSWHSPFLLNFNLSAVRMPLDQSSARANI